MCCKKFAKYSKNQIPKENTPIIVRPAYACIPEIILFYSLVYQNQKMSKENRTPRTKDNFFIILVLNQDISKPIHPLSLLYRRIFCLLLELSMYRTCESIGFIQSFYCTPINQKINSKIIQQHCMYLYIHGCQYYHHLRLLFCLKSIFFIIEIPSYSTQKHNTT